MKKSEIYKMAQEAVVLIPCFKTEEKLEILRELMRAEDLERHIEEHKEKANETV